MDASVARSFEAVTISARRLREHLRYAGTVVESSVRCASFRAPCWMVADLLDSLENSDVVRVDANLAEVEARPTTPMGWVRAAGRRRRAKKINIPRLSLDEGE